jgi:hypothetical protein
MTENIYMLRIDNSSLVSLISSTTERLISSSSIHQGHLKFFLKSVLYKIRKWLQNQDDYSLQKPVLRNFKRAKVIVSDPNEHLDVDWADMQSLSKDNDGIEYLLVVGFYQLWQNVKIFSGFITVKISIYHCLYGSIESLYIISFHLIHDL